MSRGWKSTSKNSLSLILFKTKVLVGWTLFAYLRRLQEVMKAQVWVTVGI